MADAEKQKLMEILLKSLEEIKRGLPELLNNRSLSSGGKHKGCIRRKPESGLFYFLRTPVRTRLYQARTAASPL